MILYKLIDYIDGIPTYAIIPTVSILIESIIEVHGHAFDTDNNLLFDLDFINNHREHRINLDTKSRKLTILYSDITKIRSYIKAVHRDNKIENLLNETI